MRCAVYKCNNDNNSKASPISFYKFPSNAVLQKKWIKFCCRKEKFTAKTSVICMDHFKPDDFSNKLEYDMGFTTRRLLRHGSVPSVKKRSEESERIFKEREERIQKRENKKTVEILITEYEAASALVEETSQPVNQNELEKYEIIEFLDRNVYSSYSKKDDGKDDIERLQSEIKFLRGENFQLKTAKQKLESQVEAISEQMEKKSKIYEFDMEILRTQLAQANYELNNLEENLLSIFSSEEIENLKVGIKTELNKNEK